MPDTATRGDRLRAAHDKLPAAVAEIASGDDWKRMLQVASKFHRYSFNNQVGPPSIGPPASAATSGGGSGFARRAVC